MRLVNLQLSPGVAACLGLWALACCGCALPRSWSDRRSDHETSLAQPDDPKHASSDDSKAGTKDKAAEPAPEAGGSRVAGVDPQMLEPMMAELHALRHIDPAAHDQLLADLKQVDPKHWPMLVQGFKASLEYRQRKQSLAIAPVRPAAPAATLGAPPTPRLAGPDMFGPLQAAAEAESKASQPHASAAAGLTSTAKAADPNIRLTSATDAKPSAPPADWRQPLEATIRSLEAAVAESPGPAEDDRQVNLRLLYLLAGDRDKALRPLASHDTPSQEFWSRELYALSTYLDAQKTSDRSRRAAEAAVHHWEASGRLSQQANLSIRNPAFCTEVMSYGVYVRFERYEFQPGQHIVLYAEVENFLSEPTPRGYHTALESSYQIFDARGQKVEDRDFPLMEEYCQNARRDFFIAYEDVKLPSQIYDGKYTLKLTLVDTLGNKVGQSSLDFQIKSASSDRGRTAR